ncbi:MAG: hypothetical protein LKE31_03965 [Bacilli bacterium]|jgi:hypothetical protein|nr:hypothetical protein [Bacilli bacterium]
MKIILTNHAEFETFQDLAYDSYYLFEKRRLPTSFNQLELNKASSIFTANMIGKVEGLVSPIKSNDKLHDLIKKLKGIFTTTSYHFENYKNEHNTNANLSSGYFDESDVQFDVNFSSSDETVEIDLPDEHVKALKEGYRLIMAVKDSDYGDFINILNEYGKSSYDKYEFLGCFWNLAGRPLGLKEETVNAIALYERLFMKEN